MRTVLITGISGFLGWNLCRQAPATWKIAGTSCTKEIHISGVSVFKIDLTKLKALTRLFKEINPDAVIHTAALANPNYVQTHPAESHKINVEVSERIAELCAASQIPCAFTSTDLVFKGTSAPYCETDAVAPVMLYGEQKVAAEEHMLRAYPSVAVCRMPLMFGEAGLAAASFIQPMLKTLRSGGTLQLFEDEFRTPLSGRDAASALWFALEKVTGIIHFGGNERISRLAFGKLLTDVFQENSEQLMACRQADVPLPAPRPADVSLDSRLARSLGFHPSSLEQELRQLYKYLG